jgi:hypothetical protein
LKAKNLICLVELTELPTKEIAILEHSIDNFVADQTVYLKVKDIPLIKPSFEEKTILAKNYLQDLDEYISIRATEKVYRDFKSKYAPKEEKFASVYPAEFMVFVKEYLGIDSSFNYSPSVSVIDAPEKDVELTVAIPSFGKLPSLTLPSVKALEEKLAKKNGSPSSLTPSESAMYPAYQIANGVVEDYEKQFGKEEGQEGSHRYEYFDEQFGNLLSPIQKRKKEIQNKMAEQMSFMFLNQLWFEDLDQNGQINFGGRTIKFS